MEEPVVEEETVLEEVVTEAPIAEDVVVKAEEEPMPIDVTTAAVEEVVAETTPAPVAEPDIVDPVIEEVLADEPAAQEVVEEVVADEPVEEVVETSPAEEMIGNSVVEEVSDVAEESPVVLSAEAPLPVEDTPEVAAAREEFLRLYNEAAIRAAEAPDHDLDGSLSTHSGYLSKVDGSLSPFYTNTYPYGAYGLHVRAVVPTHVHPIHYALNGLPFSYTVKN